MLFNTLEFLIFFPVVAIVYYVMGGGGNRLSNSLTCPDLGLQE